MTRQQRGFAADVLVLALAMAAVVVTGAAGCSDDAGKKPGGQHGPGSSGDGAVADGALPDGALPDGAAHHHGNTNVDAGEVTETEPPTGEPWSDPKTWASGEVPKAGDDVVIPSGKQVLLDVSPPSLGEILIDGKLVFDERDLSLRASRILVAGMLQIGSAGRLFDNEATVTLTGDDPTQDEDGTGTRGIIVTGKLELHGKAPMPTWTKLAASASAGATTLAMLDATDWRAGDELIVASTDYHRLAADETVSVQSASGNEVTLAGALSFPHWGVLQYVDADGMTLTETTSISKRVLDERAEVGNLTRPITIQGADDSLWQDSRFGAHVMIHHGGVAHVQGVRLQRVGQAGHMARYPLHFHLLSYATDGAELGDVTGQYFRNSVVTQSGQRCLVIHGTNGLTAADNICYDITGHAFFLEDAVERRNVLEHNLVIGVHQPRADQRLMAHEEPGFRRGPAGFWLTNPDNIVRDNAVASSDGMGFWLALPDRPLGLLKAVVMQPRFLPFGVFDDNTAHGNAISGLMFDFAPTNDDGDTAEALYVPSVGGVETSDYDDHLTFAMRRFTSYKHEMQDGDGVFWNRALLGTFEDFVLADFDGVGFKGASQDCIITGGLVVGESLNDANHAGGVQPAEGAASYHSECRIEKNVFVNLPGTPNQPGGAFSTADYYTRGVDKGLTFNANNTLINTHPGYRVPSPSVLGTENFSIAGALWDPHGYWGPKDYYWVYDLPFLTAGTTCAAVTPALHDNDRMCQGPYYGVTVPVRDHEDIYDDSHAHRALRIERRDHSAVWEVPQGVEPGRLLNMRNGALVRDGEFVVTTPGTTPGHSVDFEITNVLGESDGVLLAFEYDGTKTPIGYVTSWPGAREVPNSGSWSKWKAGDSSFASDFLGEYWRPLKAGANKAAVTASNGDTYFQDTANDLIWVKVRRLGLATSDYADPLYVPLTYVFDDEL